MGKANFKNYEVEAAAMEITYKCSNGSLNQAVKEIEKIIGTVDMDKFYDSLNKK